MIPPAPDVTRSGRSLVLAHLDKRPVDHLPAMPITMMFAARLAGIPALLTTTMPNMRGVVDAVRAANLPVKVVVGGAPVTAEFAEQIGADGYAPDAGAAVDLARSLLAG